jgi:ABC-2 type transport system permease protein
MSNSITADTKPSPLEWRFAAIRNGVRDALAYRGDFLIEFFSSALVPVSIQLILWYSIFHNTGQTSFGGMTYSELLAYTWTSVLFSQVRGGDKDFELAEMIRTGTLNNYLLRPVGVIEFTFYRAIGEKLLTTAFCFVLGIIVLLYLKLSILNLILAMSLALMGNIIHYLFGSALAAVAFYWENGFAILMVKNMAVSLLSGEVLPLSIVPAKFAWIWQSTPFYLYVYGPTQITLGKWDHAMWLKEMMIGLIWILVFWALIKIVWGISVKRYQGIGG